ncbi:hypothetical protein Tco_1167186 [Tanacetum coccineum]
MMRMLKYLFSKAISELTDLKGVGPATASAVLAAYAPNVAPFMFNKEVHSGFLLSEEEIWAQNLSPS